MAITIDTEALALADELIKEHDLVSIHKPFSTQRTELRIALGAAIKKFADKRVADQAKHHVVSDWD